MLDTADHQVAKKLADRHLYPFALNTYINIFRHFSHFPIPQTKSGAGLSGKTVTVIALAAHSCFNHRGKDFPKLFEAVRQELEPAAAPYFPQDIGIDTLLGCLLYYYHPSEVSGAVQSVHKKISLHEKQLYELNFKKHTFLKLCI